MIAKLNKSFCGISQGLIINNSFKANIKSVLVSNKNLFSQAISINSIACIKQIHFAVIQTLQAMDSNSMHLSNPSLELLLHLTGVRQVNKALNLLELNEFNEKAVLIVVGKNKEKVKKELIKLEKLSGIKKNSKLIELNFFKNKKELMKLYEIEETELNLFKDKNKALKELIIEHNSQTVFL
jgi:tRNA threonylcarbamoyladenosine modification (KEOPS) complex Cgi121 subunit